jgi:hypothetical protein
MNIASKAAEKRMTTLAGRFDESDQAIQMQSNMLMALTSMTTA